MEEIGGPPTPGIGFGLGVERALIALQSLAVEMPPPAVPTAFIVIQGEAARPVGIKLLADLRAAGISAQTEYGGRSMKAQMKAADRAHAHYALILGDDEIAANTLQLKSLYDGWQHHIPLSEAVEWLEGGGSRRPSP